MIPNRCCFLNGEAQEDRSGEGNKDAQLGPCADEKHLRVGNQRAKVGHATQSQEDEAWDHLPYDPVLVEELEKLRVALGVAKERGIRKVDKKNAKADGQQQIRLKVLDNGHVEEEQSYAPHDDDTSN